MRQQTGVDLWTVPADARCITTNGAWRSDGCAVMGRGCAKEAATLYVGLARHFGRLLKANGNHVQVLLESPEADDQAGEVRFVKLASFPVKHRWDQPADLQLIVRSAAELVALADDERWQTVVLPRPGCGNGRLRWEDVEPILAPILDDRFLVVTK